MTSDSWLKIILDWMLSLLSSCNLTSFFLFLLLLFGNEVMCQRSLFLLGDNKHFFLSFKYRSCLLDLLAFLSFRFDGVYFKVENIFFCQNVGKYDKRRRFYFLFFHWFLFFSRSKFWFWIFFWFRFFLLRCMH